MSDRKQAVGSSQIYSFRVTAAHCSADQAIWIMVETNRAIPVVLTNVVYTHHLGGLAALIPQMDMGSPIRGEELSAKIEWHVVAKL
jgi:hypothetical protein